MKTAYFDFNVNKAISDRAKEIKKVCSICVSTWYFDTDTNTVVICTTHPGLWIGRYGQDVNLLKEHLNEVKTEIEAPSLFNSLNVLARLYKKGKLI